MKKLFLFTLLLAIGGCASTDRMVRMSGGVFDEYSAPKSSRIRSQKYQKVTRELASSRRSNKIEVAGMDDTLINIWPFFFRSNAYWSILWPLVDKDPYGFAFRPFYNQEGDDYSVLFPLSAWNPEKNHGWVTLFAWTSNAFGFVPLTWQWKNANSGGAYYTPLFIYDYDDNAPRFSVSATGNPTIRWHQDELDLFCLLFYYGKENMVDRESCSWLYNMWFNKEDMAKLKNEWNYRFQGKKPFPENRMAFEKYRQEIFNTLPRVTETGYGFFPLWFGFFKDDDSYSKQRFLLFAGMEKSTNRFEFDIFGSLLASYSANKTPRSRHTVESSEFNSIALLSSFETDTHIKCTDIWHKFDKLHGLISWQKPFSQQKPAIEDALKKLDPALTLPATVVDANTYTLFLDDLWKKYEFPLVKEYKGCVLPLFSYHIDESDNRYSWTLPTLLTGWGRDTDGSTNFSSLPLLTFIKRNSSEETNIILSPLVYYGKSFHRERSNYPIFSRQTQSAAEYQCVEQRDQYAACGLFYRGKFGFNIVKEGFDAKTVEALRNMLITLHNTRQRLSARDASIKKETSINDRWKTSTEIERLKKLIRYEELKISRAKLNEDVKEYMAEVAKALDYAKKLNFPLDIAALSDAKKAEAARIELMEKYTEIRFYEDIGNGMIFHKSKYYNGDHHWHFMHLLAGGEKVGDKESTHILHLLYRSRKEGTRSEKIIFPFISSVSDGENSKVSFLWRFFSLSKRDGKVGGHILFIPFGSEW